MEKIGSSVDALTERLRRSIISGEIAPGDRIPMKELEERFAVSHIPIREALRRLEAEQLVTSIPRRGAIATPVSKEELVDVYELRRMIEPEVAVRSASVMSAENLSHVKAKLRGLDRLLRDAPHSDDFIEADRSFHWAILSPGANPLIERTLRQLWQMSERYVQLGMRVLDTPKKTIQQHHDIVDAVSSRDDARIRESVRMHLSLTEDAVSSMEPAGSAG